MNHMQSAPKDGTRVLILNKLYSYDGHMNLRHRDEQWVECWFDDGEANKWREWFGDKRIMTTAGVDPMGWVEIPDSQLI